MENMGLGRTGTFGELATELLEDAKMYHNEEGMHFIQTLADNGHISKYDFSDRVIQYSLGRRYITKAKVGYTGTMEGVMVANYIIGIVEAIAEAQSHKRPKD